MLAANGSLTAAGVAGWYRTLRQPPGTPPDWVFGPVWTTLYVTIGLSAFLVWSRIDAAAERKRAALRCWGWQLLLNALWPAAFFGLHRPDLALALILALLLAIGVTLRRFAAVRRSAALLLLPYLGWTAYAAYLNAGVWWLNR